LGFHVQTLSYTSCATGWVNSTPSSCQGKKLFSISSTTSQKQIPHTSLGNHGKYLNSVNEYDALCGITWPI
jgi:hypothetical protein